MEIKMAVDGNSPEALADEQADTDSQTNLADFMAGVKPQHRSKAEGGSSISIGPAARLRAVQARVDEKLAATRKRSGAGRRWLRRGS